MLGEADPGWATNTAYCQWSCYAQETGIEGCPSSRYAAAQRDPTSCYADVLVGTMASPGSCSSRTLNLAAGAYAAKNAGAAGTVVGVAEQAIGRHFAAAHTAQSSDHMTLVPEEEEYKASVVDNVEAEGWADAEGTAAAAVAGSALVVDTVAEVAVDSGPAEGTAAEAVEDLAVGRAGTAAEAAAGCQHGRVPEAESLVAEEDCRKRTRAESLQYKALEPRG